MVVDYQTHWHPRAYLESIEGRRRIPSIERIDGGYIFHGPQNNTRRLSSKFIELGEQIADMDENGVDVMVCSPAMFGEVGPLELSDARETTRLLNEEMARAQREHPSRFVGLGMLPMQETASALEELEHAIVDLGLGGVCMISHINGREIADETTLPVYQRIEELGVPIFIHPAQRSTAYHPGDARPLEAGLGWTYDTSRAVLSLILSGTMDKCPRLTVVQPHLGGVLPYIAGRLSAASLQTAVVVERAVDIERAPSEYFSTRFFIDSVNQTEGALPLAIRVYGLDRILLATDFPFQPRKARLDDVRNNGSADEVDQIFNHNVVPGLTLPATAGAGG